MTPYSPHHACGADPVIDSVNAPTSAVNAELGTRFQRDAIPLLEPLYRRALRMTKNRPDAEDLLQDTLLTAYNRFGSFRAGTNLNAWLHRLLTNAYIDSYRRKQRRPERYPTEQVSDQQLAASAGHSSTGLRSAEDEALERLLDPRIAAALRALPEHLRMSVHYADVAGFRYDEIAQIMNTRPGTVKSRLHRARRQLRHLLFDISPNHDSSRRTRRDAGA